MKKILYIDICDNLRMFSILEKTKEIKKKINNKKFKKVINFFLLLKYRIYMIFHIKKRINFENTDFLVIYLKNEKKLNKILKKIFIKEKNVVISKKLEELIKKENKNYFKNQQYKQIVDKSMYIKNVEEVAKYVIEKNGSKIGENNVYFLMNNNNYNFTSIIINCSINFKNLAIITNNIKQFEFLEKNIISNYGIYIVISNNKKKSLLNAKYIINIDYSEQNLNSYNINRDAIIFNLSEYNIKNIKGFNGLIINNIKWKNSKKYEKNRYIYSRFDNYMSKQKERLEISELIGNNGYIYLK